MAKRIPWPFWVRVDRWGDASVYERLPNGRTRRIVSRTSMERAEAWLVSWGREYGIVYEDTSAWQVADVG